MKKHFKIDYGTYPFDCLIYIGHSDEEVIKHFERNYYNLSDEEKEVLEMRGHGRAGEIKGGYFLRLEDLDIKNPNSLALMSHEIFHLVDFLLRRIGMTLSEDSDEAYAYLIQYLTEQILKKIQ